MDDPYATSSAVHATRSAEALRELKERAHAVRTAQREQLAGLERQLVDQIDAVLAAENESLQQKFQLALDDVRRLRSRVADLEQELARRPEADETDSAELVHLRAERDALAERVEELEKQPTGQSDVNTDQEVADLQRRFELAVEDVRELKRKNSELDAQLAQTAKKTTMPADGVGMDWESQKQRLLASLESEGMGDPGRQKELATIEGTIRITDEVVADKDEEIATLREQLTSLRASSGKVPIDRERELAIDRLVDEDEIIQHHRKRIALLEQEMEEKLRAAELELSVERATLARQKAELAEARLEFETIRKSGEPPAELASAGPPKRRWLSKLGLSGEEEK